MSDGFILVTKSKAKKNSRKLKNIANVDTSIDFDLDKTTRLLENIKVDLINSDFFEKAFRQLEEVVDNKSIKEIICLGIGKISEDIIARHQLAFISIVKEKFKISNIKFYDPVFDQNDKEILSSLNFEILKDNTEGKYTALEHTIFYLPHCPKQITNNLLYSNWNFTGLKNLILICNSFKTIIESTPERFLKPNAHYLLEVNHYTTELEIENSFKFNDIFNDFSIHYFQSTNLPEASSDFWNNPQPSYSSDDLEFVTNGGSKDITRNS